MCSLLVNVVYVTQVKDHSVLTVVKSLSITIMTIQGRTSV